MAGFIKSPIERDRSLPKTPKGEGVPVKTQFVASCPDKN